MSSASDQPAAAGDSGQPTDAEAAELLKYLDEVLQDYQRYVGEIGRLGYAAPQLLYYRDEVQDLMEALEVEDGVDMKPRWARIRDLDNQVRARASDLVGEVGHANFKQYQIVNNPPLTRWWWYLNRTTANPEPAPRPAWQWWRKG